MKKVVLIIEDNSAIRESLSELLNLDGYEVLEASSGESALFIIEIHKPDVIICDLAVQGIDGYQIYEYVRGTHASAPFIFSTAIPEKRNYQKAREMGISHYLVKPFDETQLLWCIEETLAKN